MRALDATAYVKYNADRIIALLCRGCLTVDEEKTVNAQPDGILPIGEVGTIVCDRCGKEA